MVYAAVKAGHIIFVIAWMAGMLIFPRYKIHQLSSSPGEVLFETMADASARLRRIILTPSLIIVWILAVSMILLNPALLQQGWFHVKLFLVVLLSGLHGVLISMGRKIDKGSSVISTKKLKLLNELPFLIMIPIVLLAVIKPSFW